MTVYAELLKLALAEPGPPEQTREAMLQEAASLRAELDRPGDAASRLAASLTYDVILARLCETFGVAHDLTGEAAGPVARDQAERALASVVPTLQAAPGKNGGR